MSSIAIHLKKSFSVIFALLVGCGFSACRKPVKEGEKAETPFPNLSIPSPFQEKFPVERVILDQQGRQLDTTIVGRSDSDLFVIRKSDGMEFTIPIANLTQADRDFAFSLPKSSVSDNFGKPKKRKESAESHPFIKTRLEAIANLEKMNERLYSESKTLNSDTLRRNRVTQAKRNEKEISEMKTDIETYEIDHNLD